MWAKIKKALNSTLGRESFDSLNKIMEIDEYHNFYREMYIQSVYQEKYSQSTTGSGYVTPKARMMIDISGKKNLPAGSIDDFRGRNYTGAKSFDCIVAPWVETLEEDALMSDKSSSRVGTLFLPPALKKIGNNTPNSNVRLMRLFDDAHIPESVEQISENAFSSVSSDKKVYIHNKQGAIPGAPWGHPGGESKIIYIP